MNDDKNLSIHWFPGHMTKALRMLADEIKNCDLVVYMLDARAPMSCLNPSFEEITQRRPTLFVLNKVDLSPENSPLRLEGWMPKADGVCIKMNSTASGMRPKAIEAITRLMKPRIDAFRAKGVTKTLRAMVIGVPNCGKSTFINNLASRAKTVTGDRPGVTKGKQWLSISDNLWLLDTPGTLYPKITNPQVALNLAYIGSIKDDILPLIEISKQLLVDLEKLKPGCVAERFNATDFDEICKKRGYVLRGGILDEERAAKAIMTEFRAGKLGRFNLDDLL